jgi:hypothetical protein
MEEVEELNREFTRRFESTDGNGRHLAIAAAANTQCDPRTDTVIVLEYEWSEQKQVETSRVLRNRPLILGTRGAADTVDVQIQEVILAGTTTRFECIPKILRDSHTSVLARIDGRSPLSLHEFEWALLDEGDSKGTLTELELYL